VTKQNVPHDSKPEEKYEENDGEVKQVVTRFIHCMHEYPKLGERGQKLEDEKRGNQQTKGRIKYVFFLQLGKFREIHPFSRAQTHIFNRFGV